MQHISMTCMSVLDDGLEAAPEHALPSNGIFLSMYFEARLDHIFFMM
jgi:hypothetical protein